MPFYLEKLSYMDFIGLQEMFLHTSSMAQEVAMSYCRLLAPPLLFKPLLTYLNNGLQ